MPPTRAEATVTIDAGPRAGLPAGTDVTLPIRPLENRMTWMLRHLPGLLLLCGVLLLSACGAAQQAQPEVAPTTEEAEEAASADGEATTRAFTHVAGTTQVPTDPQRIVTLQDQNALLPLLDEADAFFASLDAAQQGRVIYLDPSGDLANALGFSSPLSLPFALDGFVPQLAAAVDDDPDRRCHHHRTDGGSPGQPLPRHLHLTTGGY